MRVVVTDEGRVCGFFLTSQLGEDALATAREQYGCADAAAVHFISDEEHARSLGAVYWDGEKLIDRPFQELTASAVAIVADAQDEFLLSRLPENAEVFVNDEAAGVVSGGVFTMVSDSPGTYQIRSVIWPFIDYHITVEAG